MKSFYLLTARWFQNRLKRFLLLWAVLRRSVVCVSVKVIMSAQNNAQSVVFLLVISFFVLYFPRAYGKEIYYVTGAGTWSYEPNITVFSAMVPLKLLLKLFS